VVIKHDFSCDLFEGRAAEAAAWFIVCSQQGFNFRVPGLISPQARSRKSPIVCRFELNRALAQLLDALPAFEVAAIAGRHSPVPSCALGTRAAYHLHHKNSIESSLSVLS
jgi:hypothetical protein